MLNKKYHHVREQSNNSKHHRSNRSSPALAIHNGTNQYLNNHTYHQTDVPTSISLLSSFQCSAYFISRVDLNDYTFQTLKQTIDSVVSGPKAKGLKVKLSLPDEGLIIDNIPDPNQSWLYKTSELLYFWRDSYYVNIIVVITINRSRYQTTGRFSASIFRLRGNESVQLFLQRAQQFFAQLSITNNPRNNTKTLLERSATAESMLMNNNNRNGRKRSRDHTRSPERSVIKFFPPIPPARTEFDPKKSPTIDSVFGLYSRRTYSETTTSSDTRTSDSKKQTNHNYDDDDKMTTVSNYLPGGYVAELMRELRQLRDEIAALKVDTRFTPVRSTSTSPLVIPEEHSNHKMNVSQSEVDAETQTDFSLIDTETKMVISNGHSAANKRKNEQLNTKINKRALLNGSNNNGYNREEVTLGNSSQINGSSNGISSAHIQEDFQPTPYLSKPRSILKTYQNGSSVSNSVGKDLSTIPMNTEPSLRIKTGEVISFRALLEDTITSPVNIYENIPITIPTNPNQRLFSNENNLQKQYLSQLYGPQNGLSSFLPSQSPGTNTNHSSPSSSIIPETTFNSQQFFQQAVFSDHLTNPLFNIDKQLLANTIANQFGIDLNSPYLQKLIANQHLFATHKRTFANMVWPITPEEENILCSSPVITTKISDIKTVDSNSSTARSILKLKKSPRSIPKGQHIRWNSALE